MIFELVQHEADIVQLKVGIRVGLEPTQNTLKLQYQIKGELENLIIPKPNKTLKRLDNLWKNTCFEAFFKFKHSSKYIELNLSPFSAYNAYIFDNYRNGMGEYKISEPQISSEEKETQYSFIAEFAEFSLNDFSHVSITAILKLKSAETTHWAIKHSSEKPDFHLAESFVEI